MEDANGNEQPIWNKETYRNTFDDVSTPSKIQQEQLKSVTPIDKDTAEMRVATKAAENINTREVTIEDIMRQNPNMSADQAEMRLASMRLSNNDRIDTNTKTPQENKSSVFSRLKNVFTPSNEPSTPKTPEESLLAADDLSKKPTNPEPDAVEPSPEGGKQDEATQSLDDLIGIDENPKQSNFENHRNRRLGDMIIKVKEIGEVTLPDSDGKIEQKIVYDEKDGKFAYYHTDGSHESHKGNKRAPKQDLSEDDLKELLDMYAEEIEVQLESYEKKKQELDQAQSEPSAQTDSSRYEFDEEAGFFRGSDVSTNEVKTKVGDKESNFIDNENVKSFKDENGYFHTFLKHDNSYFYTKIRGSNIEISNKEVSEEEMERLLAEQGLSPESKQNQPPDNIDGADNNYRQAA